MMPKETSSVTSVSGLVFFGCLCYQLNFERVNSLFVGRVNLKKHHSTQTASESAAVHNDLASTVKKFASAHQTAITGGAAVLLLILATLFLSQRRDNRALQATELLARARVAEDFEAVTSRYRRTPSAPLAMLQAARVYYETGVIPKSLETYEAFLKAYPKHPLVETALIGRLHCLEVMSRYDDAMRGFAEFSKEYPDHPLQPQALMGKARCLEALGRVDEARIAYEDFIALNPDSRWIPQAEQALRDLNRRIRMAQQPRTDTPPSE